MYICPKCNYRSNTPVYYCSNCETKMLCFENEQQYKEYKDRLEPPPPRNLGKKIPGIILGICGFILSIVGTFYSLLISMFEPLTAIFFIACFTVESLTLCILGRVFCRKCVKDGDTTSPARTVAGMSLVGIIINAFVLLITIISFT